jgi:alkanesulfonate monooxygenase SsuD/methylene tetrahydromethanopterin reductase-like flavin-dependent oxidoreductase (luciferase family)
MELGIYFDLRNPARWRRPWPDVYARCLDICSGAEELRVSSVWLSEHHLFADGYLPQPLTLAAAIAARTRRVRIGTAVLLAPLRTAVTIAEEAAIVDILSRGRLELGLGAGYRHPEFDLFGSPMSDRHQATDRRVVELRRIWSEGKVTPPPVQDPIPLWLGYQGPQGARRAGRLGVGLLSLRPGLSEPYLAGLQEGGHPIEAARMGGVVRGIVAYDPEATWSRVRDHAAYQWDSYAAYAVEGTEQGVPHPIEPDSLRHSQPGGLPRFAVMTPAQMAALIRSYVGDRPVRHVFFWADLAGIPEDIVEDHVKLIGTSLSGMLSGAGAEG